MYTSVCGTERQSGAELAGWPGNEGGVGGGWDVSATKSDVINVVVA